VSDQVFKDIINPGTNCKGSKKPHRAGMVVGTVRWATGQEWELKALGSAEWLSYLRRNRFSFPLDSVCKQKLTQDRIKNKKDLSSGSCVIKV
jgi:hypothetical protein